MDFRKGVLSAGMRYLKAFNIDLTSKDEFNGIMYELFAYHLLTGAVFIIAVLCLLMCLCK